MSVPERDDGGVDVEAAWAEIVARWDDDAARPPQREPRAPTDDPTTESPADPGADAAGAHPDGDDAAVADDGTLTEDHTDDDHGEHHDWDAARSHVGGELARDAVRERSSPVDDEEGGFVPPEPPPLPHGDLTSRLAWAGVLGSPLFFLVCALFWRDVPRLLVVAAAAAFVAGFVVLVLRMPSSRDSDSGDGAVV